VIRAVVVAVVAVLCIWALVAWAYRPLACNEWVNEMQARTDLARETGDSYRATVMARDNLTELRRREGPCRTTTLLYVLEADNEDLLGRREASIDALRRALTIDQRPELYFQIGTLLVELGRMDEAVENYVMGTRIRRSSTLNIPSPEAERRVRLRLEELERARRK